MENLQRFEDKKKHNERFLASFAYWADINDLKQSDLAKLINRNSSQISDYKAGKKRVKKETMEALVRVSGGKLSIAFMEGLTDYMLLANTPDAEIIEIKKRRDNPDYDVQQKEKTILQHSSSASNDQVIPSWADSLIQLVGSNVKETELLRIEVSHLQESIGRLIQENKILKQEIQRTSAPHKYNEYVPSIPMAAENQE